MKIGRGIGEVLLTAGFVVLLYVVYLLKWTDVVQHRTQHALRNDLRDEWSDPTYTLDQVSIGKGLAVLRIPRFGKDYSQVIVQGASPDDLAKGPGHILGTAAPGAAGNFVVAGHRTTHGHPFKQMATFKPGDVVVVETRTQWLTYKVDKMQEVLPTAVDILEPVPPEGFSAPGHYITFSTCTPEFSASHRLVMFGELVETEAKAPSYVPKALRPGVVTATDLARQV